MASRMACHGNHIPNGPWGCLRMLGMGTPPPSGLYWFIINYPGKIRLFFGVCNTLRQIVFVYLGI